MRPRVFEETVLPHLDAAFNYARWLTRNDAEAEDVVQDACVRAMRFFPSLREADARAWLFTIVRNTWYSRISRRAKMSAERALHDGQDHWPDEALDPEERLLQQHTISLVRGALEQLTVDFREVLVLREIEGLSCQRLSHIASRRRTARHLWQAGAGEVAATQRRRCRREYPIRMKAH